MDTYTAAYFKKHQAAIFKSILKEKRPVEITVNAVKTNDSNESFVLLSKDEYKQLATIKAHLVDQATSNIQQFARHQKAGVLKTEAEIEDWLNEDE